MNSTECAAGTSRCTPCGRILNYMARQRLHLCRIDSRFVPGFKAFRSANGTRENQTAANVSISHDSTGHLTLSLSDDRSYIAAYGLAIHVIQSISSGIGLRSLTARVSKVDIRQSCVVQARFYGRFSVSHMSIFMRAHTVFFLLEIYCASVSMSLHPLLWNTDTCPV